MKRYNYTQQNGMVPQGHGFAYTESGTVWVKADDAERRVAALEEGLQEYGRHKSGCGYFDPEVLDCTCGLSALKEDT
jgi:hypothetical protein